MYVWQAVVLGVIQGLAEFLPISSTAHLFLAQKLLGLSDVEQMLSFDIVLHLGTVAALLLVFLEDILGMIEEAFLWAARRPAKRPGDRALILPILVGTVPGAIAGLTLLKKIEEERTLAVVGASMLFAALYFFFSERLAERRAKRRPDRDGVTVPDSLWIGIAQGAAGLMAGFSRSGFTIATGRVCGLTRDRSARFSFLLAVPIILGAGAKALLDLHRHPEPLLSVPVLAAGFAASFLVGVAAVRFLLAYLRRGSLRPFGVYLGFLGALLLLAPLVFPGLG